jgi:hypothetical protein
MTSAGAAAAGNANAATMATSSNDITAVKARRRILVICISPSLDPVWTTSIPRGTILVNQSDLGTATARYLSTLLRLFSRLIVEHVVRIEQAAQVHLGVWDEVPVGRVYLRDGRAGNPPRLGGRGRTCSL